METLALLGGMVVILMIKTPSILISFSWICFDWLWPSEVWQIMDHWKKSLIWDTEGGQSSLILLMLTNLPLTILSWLVWGLKTSCLVVLGRTIGDQDLLSSCPNIVFEHGVFVCSPKQVIHRCMRLFCKRLKKWCVQADASLEDLQDDIHTAKLHLEHNLPEPLHVVSKQFILLQLDFL